MTTNGRATLAGQAHGRGNNLLLLRVLCAMTVMVFHSYYLTHADAGTSRTGLFLGTAADMAVNIFFILSGFLVTSSLLRRRDPLHYALARSLRILPALAAIAVLSALIIGPLFSALSPMDYFTSLQVWAYIPITAATHPDMSLPGVFQHGTAPGQINVPLWTLRYELVMYLALAMAGFCGLLATRRRLGVLLAALLALYVYVTFATGWRGQTAFAGHMMRFTLAFFAGVAFYRFAGRIRLSGALAIAAVPAAFALRDTPLAEPAAIMAAAYGAFWFGYVPGGIMRKFNKLGDLTYGIYITHWPVEQAMVQMVPGAGALTVFLLALGPVLLLAGASWRFIEKPALALVRPLSGLVRTRRWLGQRI